MMKRILGLGLLAALALLPACGSDDPAEPADSTAPSQIADLSAEPGALRVILSWTAPGDDGDVGRAQSYQLRHSPSAIDADNWSEAIPVDGLPAPQEAGSTEIFEVQGLDLLTEYHFSLRALDEEGNAGDLSPDLATTTLGPPEIAEADPPNGADDVGMLSEFAFTFDRPMDPATLTDANVQLLGREFEKHLRISADARSIYLVPKPYLPPGIDIEIRFNAGITDQDGVPFGRLSYTYSTGPDDCEHWADRFEPNEDGPGASHVELDQLYPGISTCEDDYDFFGFTLSESRKVTVYTPIHHVVPDPEDDDGFPNWAIFWVRENGDSYTTLGTSARPGETPSFRYNFMPGTYYAKIWSGDDEVLVVYDLEFETSEACQEDEYEDNDFRDEAKPITVELHEGLRACYLDKDWYSIPVTAGQTFTMTVDTGDYNGTRRIYAYQPGGTSFVTTNSENPTSNTLEITEDGTLDLAFEVWADDVIYDMHLELD